VHAENADEDRKKNVPIFRLFERSARRKRKMSSSSTGHVFARAAAPSAPALALFTSGQFSPNKSFRGDGLRARVARAPPAADRDTRSNLPHFTMENEGRAAASGHADVHPTSLV
jgi:hypothetical protein